MAFFSWMLNGNIMLIHSTLVGYHALELRPLAIQTTELIAQETGSLAAEVVFGSIDGIFSVLGIIAAGSSAGLTPLQTFATGLGGATAGALSVFAAMYLSQTTEKKTRLLAAWENARKLSAKKARNSNEVLRQPSKKEHKLFHKLLSRVHRRALLSGLVTSTTSTLASLILLLPLVVLSQFSPATSILTGIFLLAIMGAFRGVTLKQSAAKSAIKMIVLGIIIIVASNVLGSYVQTLLKPSIR